MIIHLYKFTYIYIQRVNIYTFVWGDMYSVFHNYAICIYIHTISWISIQLQCQLTA